MGFDHRRLVKRLDASTVAIYDDSGEILYIADVVGGDAIYGGDGTLEDLWMYANKVDNQSYIKLEGGGWIYLTAQSASSIVQQFGGYRALYVSYASNVTTITGGQATGDDLELKGNAVDANPVLTLLGGTDKIKFGAYTAGVAGDSTGYILIEDKDGNERKLMVQA